MIQAVIKVYDTNIVYDTNVWHKYMIQVYDTSSMIQVYKCIVKEIVENILVCIIEDKTDKKKDRGNLAPNFSVKL